MCNSDESDDVSGAIREQVNVRIKDEEIDRYKALFGVKGKATALLTAARYGASIAEYIRSAIDRAAENAAAEAIRKEMGLPAEQPLPATHSLDALDPFQKRQQFPQKPKPMSMPPPPRRPKPVFHKVYKVTEPVSPKVIENELKKKIPPPVTKPLTAENAISFNNEIKVKPSGVKLTRDEERQLIKEASNPLTLATKDLPEGCIK